VDNADEDTGMNDPRVKGEEGYCERHVVRLRLGLHGHTERRGDLGARPIGRT